MPLALYDSVDAVRKSSPSPSLPELARGQGLQHRGLLSLRVCRTSSTGDALHYSHQLKHQESVPCINHVLPHAPWVNESGIAVSAEDGRKTHVAVQRRLG